MGSNINVIFSDVVGSVETVGMDFLEFIKHEFSGVLTEYFCEVGYLDDDPSLDLFNYRSDLDGQQDLRERLARLGGGQFSCETFLGFTSADMDIVVFQAPQFGGTGSTVILSFEKQLIGHLRRYEWWGRFFLVLAEFANVLKAEYFVVGLDIDPWKPILRDAFSDEKMTGISGLGWCKGSFDEKVLARNFGGNVADIEHSPLQYDFLRHR